MRGPAPQPRGLWLPLLLTLAFWAVVVYVARGGWPR